MEPRQQLAMAPAKIAARDVSTDRWFVRVSGAKETLRQKCVEMGSCQEYQLIHAIYHVGSTQENPHLHMIMHMNHLIKKQALQVRIKCLFGCKGVEYSVQPWDGNTNGAGSYLYHEDIEAEPLYTKGFIQSFIDEMIEHARQWREVIAKNKHKASNKLMDKALHQFEGQRNVTEREVFRYMVKLCADGENHWPGEYVIKKYTVEVMLKHRGTDFLEYSDRLFDRAFRN